MAYDFKLPDIGEGIHEAEILKLYVKVGDDVKEDDVLAEVETDKAVVEIPIPVTGKVNSLNASEGDTIEVGQVLATFATDDDPAGDAGADDAQAQPSAAATEETAPAEKAQAGQAAATDAPPAVDAGADREAAKKVLAMPSVRKLARELGVDITQVPATGNRGQVTAADVQNFKAAPPAAPEAAAPAAQAGGTAGQAVARTFEPGSEERIPLKGIRKVIAERMVESKFTAPHVTAMDEVDVTELVELRQWAKPLAAEKEIKLTYLPFIVKAIIAGLREFPTLNASIDEEAGEIVIKHYYHIGIAAATNEGLMVPVVQHADQKTMWELADEINDLVAQTRDRKVAPDKLKGSTISISNLGSVGSGMFFTPIINYPEVAIVGIGTIAEKPVVRDGEIVIRKMMGFNVTFDHRLVDGDVAARFMRLVKHYLENPRLLMMEMK
ncbi:dihydrolipoamide acetyltransferase family protein [Numidum massiliense]|uniref:dihydrolipoamide acetyltransferase family protein n=1 Tax=Numidum massiliense TaxID=1522315 RepID=UPI0006D5956C|nr:dihydrolipoamide acetyltransferase family protein [Numidum massiliense]